MIVAGEGLHETVDYIAEHKQSVDASAGCSNDYSTVRST